MLRFLPIVALLLLAGCEFSAVAEEWRACIHRDLAICATTNLAQHFRMKVDGFDILG
jgi:hypothetical protein